MPATARVGDIAVGTCCCSHDGCVGWTGVIVAGASTKTIEGSSVARIGDLVVGCHPQIIVGGSGLQTVEGSGTARVNDPTSGCTTGIIVSGASTSSVGG